MRLWTLHPRYLDSQGLVALWREGLLARAVLRGRTRGYRRHPQLHRFQALEHPRSAINAYLEIVLAEARTRGFVFDHTKIGPIRGPVRIECTDEQLHYEWRHLCIKLQARSPTLYQRCCTVESPEPHPVFLIAPGPIAPWERPIETRAQPPGEDA